MWRTISASHTDFQRIQSTEDRLINRYDMKFFPLLKYFVMLLVVAQLDGCATVYSAKSIRATVVDADTGQPLDGVIVVAHWVLNFGWEGGGGADMVLMESVTDQNGEFFFPAWGPQRIPAVFPTDARLKGQDPAIILVRRGYMSKGLSNDRPTVEQSLIGASTRTSDWDGKTIKLEKFTGDRKQFAKSMAPLLTGLGYGGCNFKKIPRLLSTVIAAGNELRRQGLYSGLISVDDLQSMSEGRCGSVQEFFQPYLQDG